jgi:hypothetical protein
MIALYTRLMRNNVMVFSLYFREELENCLAVRTYLEDNKLVVRSSDSKWGGKRTDEASARDISSFLNDVICKRSVRLPCVFFPISFNKS